MRERFILAKKYLLSKSHVPGTVLENSQYLLLQDFILEYGTDKQILKNIT